MSLVDLTEVLRRSRALCKEEGVDPVRLLRHRGVELHAPTEDTARRVAALPCSLGDGFAAATAQELRARLHTTDRELVEQLADADLAITRY